jgi:hypothetical protein
MSQVILGCDHDFSAAKLEAGDGLWVAVDAIYRTSPPEADYLLRFGSIHEVGRKACEESTKM